MTTAAPTTLAPTTLAPTTLAPTTLATTVAPTTAPPTTLAPTTLATTIAPTTTLTTPAPTTPPPHNILNDRLFNCAGNNYAGCLFVETSMEGVSLSNSYGLAEGELTVETSIQGEVPISALHSMTDGDLIVETSISADAVCNDEKKNWVGWSKIGQADFTIDRVNDAGYRAMEYGGYVYRVLNLDNNVVIYGSRGVTIAFPVTSPAPTFGFKELINQGVKSKPSVDGNKMVHFCVTNTGCLYKITKEGLERLGYEEFLNPLTNPALNYDPSENRLYISDANEGYIYNDKALTGGLPGITGLYRVDDTIEAIGPDTVLAEAVEIITDVIDFGRRGLKSIESIQFDVITDIRLDAAIDYKYDKSEEFRTSDWKPLNINGVAHVRTAGTEFRIRLRGKTYGTFSLSYMSVQFKFIDQRFTRDPKGPIYDY